jgi:glycosyltransferase involved in cell wall biosynthesis
MQKGDGARFRRAHGIDRGDRVVGHLGRLAPEKNLSYLAEAAAGLLSRENGVFLVVGDGASAEDIRRIFQDRDLENRLVMTGKLTGEDLRDAYHAMDLFVFASKTETQGMVLVEAMAAGLPVVALDAPGVREVIRDKENGRLRPGAASTEIFAEAAAEGFRDPEAARTWSRGALSTAESFSRKHMAERLLRLYLSAQYGHQGDTRPPEEFIPWDKLLRGLKAEWDLLSQKATASMESMKEEER